MNAEDRFWWWVNERQSIYLKRLAGAPKPWTDDSFLQQYSFCNVYREQDRVTVWIRDHWREPHAESPYLWFAMSVARQINWPDTLDDIGYPSGWLKDSAERKMRQRKDAGKKVYTGAYILTSKGPPGHDKIDWTINRVLSPLWERRSVMAPQTGEGWVEWTKRLMKDNCGFGPFMAFQVASDLQWTRYFRDDPDRDTWATLGPGSMRFVNMFLGRDVEKHVKEEEGLEVLRYFHSQQRTRASGLPHIFMSDIQNSMCETAKYIRLETGGAPPRARFNGRV